MVQNWLKRSSNRSKTRTKREKNGTNPVRICDVKIGTTGSLEIAPKILIIFSRCFGSCCKNNDYFQEKNLFSSYYPKNNDYFGDNIRKTYVFEVFPKNNHYFWRNFQRTV